MGKVTKFTRVAEDALVSSQMVQDVEAFHLKIDGVMKCFGAASNIEVMMNFDLNNESLPYFP